MKMVLVCFVLANGHSNCAQLSPKEKALGKYLFHTVEACVDKGKKVSAIYVSGLKDVKAVQIGITCDSVMGA